MAAGVARPRAKIGCEYQYQFGSSPPSTPQTTVAKRTYLPNERAVAKDDVRSLLCHRDAACRRSLLIWLRGDRGGGSAQERSTSGRMGPIGPQLLIMGALRLRNSHLHPPHCLHTVVEDKHLSRASIMQNDDISTNFAGRPAGRKVCNLPSSLIRTRRTDAR